MGRGLWLFLLFSFILPAAGSASAQSQPTDLLIRGVVFDAMRAPIPGAVVVATRFGASGPVSTTTDLRGEFSLALKAGQYTVRVHADGFGDVEQRVTAGPATAAPTDFVLQVQACARR